MTFYPPPPAAVNYGADLSGNGTSVNGAQYVSSLSYSTAPGGGPIAIGGTGTTFVIAQGNTGFSLSQAQQANTSPPASITISPQAPGASASNATNGTPGSLNVNFAAPVAGGSTPNLNFQTAGSTYLAINSSVTGYASPGLDFGGNAFVIRASSNAQISGGNGIYLNADGPGTTFRTVSGFSTYGIFNSSGLQLGATASFGSGVGVLGVADAATVPTSNPTGGLVAWSKGGWWGIRGPNGIQVSTQQVTKNVSYTIDANITTLGPDHEIWIDGSVSGKTLTLPAPTPGRELIVTAIGTMPNAWTLAQHATELINGVNGSRTLQADFGRWIITTDGTNWRL